MKNLMPRKCRQCRQWFKGANIMKSHKEETVDVGLCATCMEDFTAHLQSSGLKIASSKDGLYELMSEMSEEEKARYQRRWGGDW